jgi:hypothetical protein
LAVLLARELANIQFAALAHIGRSRVAEMGIVFPNGDLRAAAVSIEVGNQRIR